MSSYREIKFRDLDIVNMEDVIGYVYGCDRDPYKLFLLHNHGYTFCVVCADNLSEALDIAADKGRLNGFELSEEETEEYELAGRNISYLGNHGKPFDTESLQAVILPVPAFSFEALFNAAFPQGM